MSGKAELFIRYSSVNVGYCLLNLLDVIWFASSLNSSLKRKVNLCHQGFFYLKLRSMHTVWGRTYRQQAF